MKVVIVGGGAIGMMQARDLALRGCQVCLLEKTECGREASWAGGGIISPLYPWRYSEPVTALARWSQSYYPNLVESLEAESGIDAQLSKHGLLILDVKDRAAALEWSHISQREGSQTEGSRSWTNKSWMNEIGSQKIYELEPQLRDGLQDALWMPHVASIRNPRLVAALKASLKDMPSVDIREQSEVVELIKENDTVKGVTLASGEKVCGDKVVICAGSWSASLLGEYPFSIEPVKGQMLLFKAEPGVVNRVVLSNGKYVIPRRDGRVLAGSTLEYTGFEKATSEEARQILSDMAIDLFPELARYPIEHHWAGLRPSSPEGVPYIGAVSDCENLYVNAGHFRNGLVLAPAAVTLLGSIVCDNDKPVDPQPYAPKNRF